MAEESTIGTCPFCDYAESDTYVLMLHVETLHSEGESPFVVRDSDHVFTPHVDADSTAATDCARLTTNDAADIATATGNEEEPEDDYVTCPEANCGEAILLTELDAHIDMHATEKMSADRSQEPDVSRHRRRRSRDSIDRDYDYDRRIHGSSKDRYHTGQASQRRVSRSIPNTSNSILRGLRSFLIGSGSPRESKQASSSPHAGHSRRLGKAELGPYAHEAQMPSWLQRLLETSGTVTMENRIRRDGTLEKVETVVNEITGAVPVLAYLCEQDLSVATAWFCHPSVRHVVKFNREGGFCGYRNIQMIISYIRGAHSPGYEAFENGTPGILRLQDLIEGAWDQGFNSVGRVETGGIKGTRKYIGTPEAQALFMSLGVPCEGRAFSKGTGGSHDNGSRAYERLMAFVESYFTGPHTSNAASSNRKIVKTNLAPIYFQHPGHSLTIIGYERRTDGSHNLLVFDPMFKPSPAIMRIVDGGLSRLQRSGGSSSLTSRRPEEMLRAYRRGAVYLRRYSAFETLQLSPSTTSSASQMLIEDAPPA